MESKEGERGAGKLSGGNGRDGESSESREVYVARMMWKSDTQKEISLMVEWLEESKASD